MMQTPSQCSPCVSEVTLVRPAASDTGALLSMLSRCSRATLFHPFHGFTDGLAYFGTLHRNGPVDRTLLAWHRSTCVGVATLGAGSTGIVDLGVLVEDAWQRRGIGTQLVAALLDIGRAEGVSTLHADVLGEDLFILEALRRMRPLTVEIEFGNYSIDIEISPPGSRLSGASRTYGGPTSQPQIP
jgi:GNAT superfamily N-acetyltransferase